MGLSRVRMGPRADRDKGEGDLEHAQSGLAVLLQRAVKHCKAAKSEATLDFLPAQGGDLRGRQLSVQLLPGQRYDPAQTHKP